MGRLRLHVGARIRWKILGPYLVLSLLLAALATVLVTRVVSGSLEERFVNQLAESARVTSDAIVRREQQHLETIRAASFTQGIVEAARNADSQEAEAIVVPIAANSGTETIAVFDADGSLVFGAQRTEEGTRTSYVTIPATDLAATADLLEAVLSGRTDNLGDKFASLVETAAGPSLVTAGPIYEGETIVGAVMVGTTLNSFLPEIKQQALADVSLYTSTGDPIATTFVTDADSILQSAPIGELAPGGASPRRTHSMAGRPYQFLFTQMFIRGEPIGTLSVALPTTFITNADATTRNQMAVLFGFATIAVLAVGVLLARLLTRPIARLVDVATAVTSGDLTVRSGIDSSDEIGTLAHTFDAMTERLQRQHLGTVRALVTAIEARDPYTRGHSVRVGHLSVELGAAIGLSESQLQHLQIGGYLHDIGKIGIRDDILLKPGALSAEERLLIEEHPRVGLEILATSTSRRRCSRSSASITNGSTAPVIR